LPRHPFATLFPYTTLFRSDRMLVVAAVLTVMIFGVLNGLLAGIAFSLALLLKSLASPRLSVLGRVGAHDYVSLARFAHAVSTPGDRKSTRLNSSHVAISYA